MKHVHKKEVGMSTMFLTFQELLSIELSLYIACDSDEARMNALKTGRPRIRHTRTSISISDH